MKILFLNLSELKFTVATPQTEPLGGTESCVCYLARELAKNGHAVALMARLPDRLPDNLYAIAHYPLAALTDASFFAAQDFDAIIAVNAPIAIPHLRGISPRARLLLWDHIPPEQPAMRELAHPDIIQTLDQIIYVSAWQKQITETKYGIAVPSRIIGNGLTPAFENLFTSQDEIRNTKQLRAAYTTIPYRGLPILLKVMEMPPTDLRLDVFSSMQVYQTSDESYENLRQQAQKNPAIQWHGAVTQRALAQNLKAAAFLTYPCICEETFCLAALEAMAAGLKIIATRTGALESTTRGFADLVPLRSQRAEDLIADYRIALDANLATFRNEPEAWAEKRWDQVQTVNRDGLWSHRAKEWETTLRDANR